MSISFTCDQCGTSLTVSASLAGRRGKCKQCGNSITVPAAPAPEEARIEGGDSHGGVDAPSKLRPATDQIFAANDVDPYGVVQDAAPSSGSTTDNDDLPRYAPSKPKRKAKPKGNFGRYVRVGVSFGAIVVIALIVARLVFNQGASFGLSGRTGVESVFEATAGSIEEATRVFKTIHDDASAQEAAPRAAEILRKLAARIRADKDKKVSEAEIEEAGAKYQPQIEVARAAWAGERQRVAAIPGASVALRQIQEPSDELAALGKEFGLAAVFELPKTTEPQMQPGLPHGIPVGMPTQGVPSGIPTSMAPPGTVEGAPPMMPGFAGGAPQPEASAGGPIRAGAIPQGLSPAEPKTQGPKPRPKRRR
jgi:hypothetical protein